MIESTRMKLTGLLLTYNEEENIQRVLDKLTWLEKIIIIDSYSTDRTADIINSYNNTEIHFRAFESFADQCNYGLLLINSEWVLSLDADYVLTDEFISETEAYVNEKKLNNIAYFCRFHFLVFGERLLNDNTTPRAVLFKPAYCTYFNDGHAHRLEFNGPTGNFTARLLHDDRKPLSRWLASQSNYSIQETDKLLSLPYQELNFISKIRKTKILAPFFVFFYCLFVQGLIFNGWRGWHYTLQRTMVEMLFALRLIEHSNGVAEKKKK